MMKDNVKLFSPIRVVAGYVGFDIFMIGVAILTTLFTLFAYPTEAMYAKFFVIPGILAIYIGLRLFLPIYKNEKAELDRNHDYLIVFFSWIFGILICSIPYFLTGNYTLTESIFESTSGLTTTGATVMNVEELPHIFLMYRSMTLYIGGVGMILIMTSLFNTTFGMRLYNAEGHQNKLIPNVIKSARMIIMIYTGYIIMGALLYIAFKMPVFDAINHAISAVANGGFSTRAESIGYYKSLPIEIVTAILSILGGTNFLLNLLLIKGNWKALAKHCETKVALILWLIFVPILTIILLGTICATVGNSFRVAFFQIIAAMTTSGFQIVDTFAGWPSAALFILSVFMIIGFQSGSTAGGIKLYRISVAAKSIWYDIKSKLKKKREIIPRKINIYGEEKDLTEETITSEHNFSVVYITFIIIGTLLFSLQGYSIEKALFDFSSLLGCVGLSTGVVGAGASNLVNWIGIFAMIIGRLDIYPVILSGLVLTADAKGWIKEAKMKKYEEKKVEE